ncbi:hypothetical protein H696_00449 [Fonticula alba]|uniref:AP-1 complex subunit gamma n=1 Tax=Fonticula alba TaxID=691883 RepID=A0A058ZG25_FONAL|nr:hypothetical protein H696_00449 [Fonticula alba]KCV72878.1 hypothetical protein H696_00449 [Fonticula alba]|eukprot:XP_009492579.1 hypothetical protein H696_00449 [Fonticula alba]
MDRLFSSSTRLKDLVRSVRSSKTAAEERAVIAKESALIRTQFKEDNADYRHRNVAKLLYIHMLGYPAQWGQIECVKLLASPRFADKRLGYLGITLLLDESQEVLTLAINSMKNDLNSSNVYINGLALAAVASITSTEMAHDLATDVERLMGSSSGYIRKKANLCAVRLVSRAPSTLAEGFTAKAIRYVLNEKHHGALLAGITLIHELCMISPESLAVFRSHTAHIIRILNALITGPPSHEHDMDGVADPFLQIRILRLLRLLGAGHPQSSDLMGDILAQVRACRHTAPRPSPPPCMVIDPTVRTIMAIEAEPSLRVMAINIIGRFLANSKDNSTRYISLNTLLQTIQRDPAAVQRHRKTVVECLHDSDVSIRRRALDLTFALMNSSNVRPLVRELLLFLERAEPALKPHVITELAAVSARYAPNRRWHLDTLIRVIRLAGNYVRDDILGEIITLIQQSPDLQPYAVLKLYTALRENASQAALVLTAVWSIGEYGAVLVHGSPSFTSAALFDDEQSLDDGAPAATEEARRQQAISEQEVLDLLEEILRFPAVPALPARQTIRAYVLNTLLKLSARFSDDQAVQTRIASMLDTFRCSPNAELQQRACEYSALFTGDASMKALRRELAEPMPTPEVQSAQPRSPDASGIVDAAPAVGGAAAGGATSAGGLLVDLLGLDEPIGVSSTPATGSSGVAALDLLSELSLGTSTAAAPATGAPAATSLDALLGLSTPATAAPAAQPSSPGGGAIAPTVQAGDMTIEPHYMVDATDNRILNIRLMLRNTSAGGLSDLKVLAAPYRSQKVQMRPLSSTQLAPGEVSPLLLRVFCPIGESPRLRLRIQYNDASMTARDVISDLDKFPVMH